MTERGRPSSVLRSRSFQLLWTARTISMTGSMVTLVVLPILVFQRTGSPLQTSLLAAFEAVPYVVFGLVAGAVADRVDRRRIMITCDLAAAGLLAVIPLAARLGLLTVPLVYLVALGAGIAFVWFDAANFGALPALVDRDQLTSANAILAGTSEVVGIAGTALGGAIAVLLGPANALALDAASYLVSALLLSLVPRAFGKPGADEPAPATRLARRMVADIREGLRYLWRQRLVRTLTLLGFGLSVTGGAVAGLLVVYAIQGLGLDRQDGRIGLLYTAGAVGGLVGTTLVPGASRRLGPGRVTLLALTANAPLLAAVAFAPGLAAGLAALLVWDASYHMVTVNGITIRQLVIPDRLQSRVNTTARIIAWGLGVPVGAALGGAIASATTVRVAYLVMAAGVVASALAAWRSPLRHPMALPAPEDAPA